MIDDAQIDYRDLIDEETWAFIRATEAHCAADATDQSVTEQRKRYDALCAAFDVGRPNNIAVLDSVVAGVAVRTYRTASTAATLIFAHGGGYVLGGLDSHDSICAELSSLTGLAVIAVDYRLAPEHRHPAAYDDVLGVTRSVLAGTSGPVVMVGDSAGAILVAAVAHTLRDRIAGQVLIYPALGGDMDSGSYLEHAHAPLLSRRDMIAFERMRTKDGPPEDDPTFAPLSETDFAGLPPVAVFTAQCDPLRDDGRLYCERILAAGGEAEWTDAPGLVHGFLRARHSVTRARDVFTSIVTAIQGFAEPDHLE